MKTTLLSFASGIVVSLLAAAAPGMAQPLDLFGKVELSVGAEREQNAPAGARVTIEALGVAPLSGNLGVQGVLHYVGGRGSRFGIMAGPVYAWGGGKAGLFLNYQYRTLRSNNFLHLIPSAAFYFDQMNLNVWYAQPVSSPQREKGRTEYGINKLQTTVSYFAGSDWASFLKKDNVELVFGVQLNTFAGAGRAKLESAGVGPVMGASFMPMKDVAVNLLRFTIDNRSRYRVSSGVEFFFGGNNATLKQARRKYLEPNYDGPQSGGQAESPRPRRCTLKDCGSER